MSHEGVCRRACYPVDRDRVFVCHGCLSLTLHILFSRFTLPCSRVCVCVCARSIVTPYFRCPCCQVHEALFTSSVQEDDEVLSDSDSDGETPGGRGHGAKGAHIDWILFVNSKRPATKKISCVIDGLAVNLSVNNVPAVCFSAIFQTVAAETDRRQLFKRSALLVQVLLSITP